MDFCSKCMAHPTKLHNERHPIIRFRTPVFKPGLPHTRTEAQRQRKEKQDEDSCSTSQPPLTGPDLEVVMVCVQNRIIVSGTSQQHADLKPPSVRTMEHVSFSPQQTS